MVDLGLPEQQFWGLTPREFDALQARERDRRLREDYRAGILAATLVNVNGGIGRSRRTARPSDFFTSLERIGRARTIAEQREALRAWALALGGAIKD